MKAVLFALFMLSFSFSIFSQNYPKSFCNDCRKTFLEILKLEEEDRNALIGQLLPECREAFQSRPAIITKGISKMKVGTPELREKKKEALRIALSILNGKKGEMEAIIKYSETSPHVPDTSTSNTSNFIIPSDDEIMDLIGRAEKIIKHEKKVVNDGIKFFNETADALLLEVKNLLNLDNGGQTIFSEEEIVIMTNLKDLVSLQLFFIALLPEHPAWEDESLFTPIEDRRVEKPTDQEKLDFSQAF